MWIRHAHPRLPGADALHGDARALENQLSRNQVGRQCSSMTDGNRVHSFSSLSAQVLQHETREMQIKVNRLNKDVVELTQDAEETLAHRLREEMRQMNESWSHIISSTKVYSQTIQVRSLVTLAHDTISETKNARR